MFTTLVVHYTPLKNRYIYLSGVLSAILPIRFITENNLKIASQEFAHSKKVFGIGPVKYGFNLGVNSRALTRSRKKAMIEGFRLLIIGLLLPNKKYILFGSIPNFVRMADSQLELILMHIKAIKAGYDSNSPWILILEDDARISEKVKVDIESICKMYQKEKTILINLNSGANMHHTRSDPKPDQFGIYRVRPIGVRCTTSYLINRETAKKLLSLFEYHKPQDWLPIDVQIQIAVQKLKGKTYWQDPPIFIQGSEDGTYLSNLR
jgi:hypothetical protein